MTDYDYSEDVEDKRGDNILAVLSAKADEARNAMNDVKAAEETLKAAKERLRNIVEVELPELMDEAGQKDCVTSGGVRLVLQENVRVSIPKDERGTRALEWLRENGHASVIKSEVSIEFGKGQDAQADALTQELRTKGLMPSQSIGVHPQTLAALVRELLRDGVEVPLDTFGGFIQREVKLK